VGASGPVVAIAVLLAGLVVAIWALVRVRKAAAGANEELEALRSRAYVDEFEADTVYRLIAKSTVTLEGREKSFGLVERQDRTITLFLTASPMDTVAEGDCFASVRGHMAKLDPGAFGAPERMAPREEDATARQPMIPREEEEPPPRRTIPREEEAPTPEPMIPREEPAEEPITYDPDEEDDRTQMVFSSQEAFQAPVDENAGLTYLKCVGGNDEGSLFHLPFDTAAIGRGDKSTITLTDPTSSRVHCKIAFENHRFVLRDNGSTNGTYCNGERVEECALEFGDRIKVADTELVFSCDGYELQGTDPVGAITAFEACIARQPDFLGALRILAFLLETDIARQAEAQPLWIRITELEKSR